MTTISIKNLTINVSPGIESVPVFLGSLKLNGDAANTSDGKVLSEDGKTVYDPKTLLTWEQAGSDKKMTYDEVDAYIAELNADKFGGFSDWRRNDDKEGESLIDRSRRNPAIYPIFSCKSDRYWTNKPWIEDDGKPSSGYVWIVDFGDGGVDGSHRGHHAFVRAVRGPSPAGQ